MSVSLLRLCGIESVSTDAALMFDAADDASGAVSNDAVVDTMLDRFDCEESNISACGGMNSVAMISKVAAVAVSKPLSVSKSGRVRSRTRG